MDPSWLDVAVEQARAGLTSGGIPRAETNRATASSSVPMKQMSWRSAA